MTHAWKTMARRPGNYILSHSEVTYGLEGKREAWPKADWVTWQITISLTQHIVAVMIGHHSFCFSTGGFSLHNINQWEREKTWVYVRTALSVEDNGTFFIFSPIFVLQCDVYAAQINTTYTYIAYIYTVQHDLMHEKVDHFLSWNV